MSDVTVPPEIVEKAARGSWEAATAAPWDKVSPLAQAVRLADAESFLAAVYGDIVGPLEAEVERLREHRAAEEAARYEWSLEDKAENEVLAADRDAALAEVERLRADAAEQTRMWAATCNSARRDALDQAAKAIRGRRKEDRRGFYVPGLTEAASIVAGLRDENAPRDRLRATVSAQTPVPRIPGTPGAVSGHSGPREGDAQAGRDGASRQTQGGDGVDPGSTPVRDGDGPQIAVQGRDDE